MARSFDDFKTALRHFITSSYGGECITVKSQYRIFGKLGTFTKRWERDTLPLFKWDYQVPPALKETDTKAVIKEYMTPIAQPNPPKPNSPKPKLKPARQMGFIYGVAVKEDNSDYYADLLQSLKEKGVKL